VNKKLGVFRDRLKDTSTSSLISLTSKEVRADQIKRIMHILVYNGDASSRDIEVYIDTHGYNHRVAYFNDVPTLEWSHYRIELYLWERERLIFNFPSFAASKIMEVHLSGLIYTPEDIIKEK